VDLVVSRHSLDCFERFPDKTESLILEFFRCFDSNQKDERSRSLRHKWFLEGRLPQKLFL